MKSVRLWLAVALLGTIVGALVGGAMSQTVDERYAAETRIQARALFNDVWSMAPPVLQQAELLRVSLHKARADESLGIHSKLIIISDVLNEWTRYIDDILFRFVIEEAYESAEIGGKVPRNVKLNTGFHDGLGQRSLVLTTFASSPSAALSELENWRLAIQEVATKEGSEALQGWLERKADAIEVFTQDHSLIETELTHEELSRIASQFRAAAARMDKVLPYADLPYKASVEEISESPTQTVLLWAVIGGALAVMGLVIGRAVRRK